MDPFTGEIRVFGFGFAPYDWAACDGSTLPLRQYVALYSLIGLTFGGDGTQTFQLPNLAGRMLCGTGAGTGLTPRRSGSAFGENQVALNPAQLPPHTHDFPVYTGGTASAAPTSGSALSNSAAGAVYVTATPDTQLFPTTISGGGLPHENRQPILGMSACIAMAGLYPTFD